MAASKSMLGQLASVGEGAFGRLSQSPTTHRVIEGAMLLKERVAEASRGVPTLWPVRGLVTSPFGARMSPYGEGREMHRRRAAGIRFRVHVSAGFDQRLHHARAPRLRR